MKAQTLAICIPGNLCDKKCPYCVSNMTWAPQKDWFMWGANLSLVRAFAERADVMDVIITGKGEPMICADAVRTIATMFRMFPVILQTNGIILNNNLTELHDSNIDVIAVSVDSPEQFEKLKSLWAGVNAAGRISRATVVLTSEVIDRPFVWWIGMAKSLGVRQLSFRQVAIPRDTVLSMEATKTVEWINKNVKEAEVVSWLDDYMKHIVDFQVVRRLSYGAVVRDVNGIAVTFFEYCVQDENGEDDIRSLIYNQDGHLYTTWNSPASMIF